MGDSAGGTLALLTGLAPATAGFDHDCPTAEPPKVAAVIDWAGVVDLAPLREGPAPKGYALSWIGDQPNADAVTNLVSPIHYVRPGLPPVFIVHADHDPVVPYAQAVMLRDALDQAGDPNTLLTLANSTVHTSPGQLTALRVDLAALTFLATHGVRLLP
jgi:acetyl esterase/lipase